MLAKGVKIILLSRIILGLCIGFLTDEYWKKGEANSNNNECTRFRGVNPSQKEKYTYEYSFLKGNGQTTGFSKNKF